MAIESGSCARKEQRALAQVHRILLPLALPRTVQAMRMLGMLESLRANSSDKFRLINV